VRAGVDEVHLVDEWGCDFRKSFADIWTLRSFVPDHVTFVAFSASVELGRQTEQVLRSPGFHKGHYYFESLLIIQTTSLCDSQ